MTKIDIDFKKTSNIISSPLYSSTWTFKKATVLHGDIQNRYIFYKYSIDKSYFFFFNIVEPSVLLNQPSHLALKFDLLLAKFSRLLLLCLLLNNLLNKYFRNYLLITAYHIYFLWKRVNILRK